MQNRRLILLAVLLVGCSRQPQKVFVDMDMVALSSGKPGVTSPINPGMSNSNVPSSRMIPGEAAMEIENLKAGEKTAIRKEIDKEVSDAIATISKRLVDYYSREFDDFYKVEFAKLDPFKQGIAKSQVSGIRKVFERFALRRAPVLTRLTFLTKFPPSVELPLGDSKGQVDSNPKKTAEIKDLKRLLVEIDHDYDVEMEKVDRENLRKVETETESILAAISKKQMEINSRAEAEATKLVKSFSATITSRIFSKYTFQLKEIPTKTVNFPKMPAQPGVPRVTFEWNQLNQNDKAELTHEVDTFISLNHYQRVTRAENPKDVTKEFIEWRTNLKSGHWENWQKPSAQK